VGTRIRQQSCPIRFPTLKLSNIKKAKGRRAMARIDLGYLPKQNPCAQCGKPIAAPEWIENGPRRTSYLWHCRACGYQFEAVAFFDDSRADPGALAA
jgi:ribosomal protein L37AE/L43A